MIHGQKNIKLKWVRWLQNWQVTNLLISSWVLCIVFVNCMQDM